MNDLNKEILQVDERGAVLIPEWIWHALLKEAGVRSKRYRVQKRVVKRLLLNKLKKHLERVR